MPEHTIGTREEWQAARAGVAEQQGGRGGGNRGGQEEGAELAKLEGEQAERNEEVKRQRLALPWVPVEKEYVFDTEDGKKTLPGAFEGRPPLLAYKQHYGAAPELRG